MLFVSADLRVALPAPTNTSSGKVVRFQLDKREKRRKRQRKTVVEGVLGIIVSDTPAGNRSAIATASSSSSFPFRALYGGERDEVISSLLSLCGGTDGGTDFVVALFGLVALSTLLAQRPRLRWGAFDTVMLAARMLLTRGAFLMAATASAVTRSHVPSHQQQYDVPVRPPVVQVWYLKRYNYSPTGRIGDVQYGLERMDQKTYYQFPAALDGGEFRSRDDMLRELFKASAFGDRGVRFA